MEKNVKFLYNLSMSKKSRMEIYIHMCNYSKSLKTTLQITDENIKILDKTEKI